MAAKDSTFTENMKNERQTNNEAAAKRLIRLYRANQCLWNRKSPGYHCTTLKQSAWNRITRILNNGLTPDQVKLQVLSLRTYYDMERQAIKRSQREGFHYVPCRSIFNDLQFLADQEPCEAEQSKSRPSVRDDQVQCIIDDVTEMMNKDCAECRHSLRVDFHIPIGERRSASSNMSFVDEELDNSSLYDLDLETLPTTLPRATSGADRYHHQQDEEESSDYSYHHQSRQQAHQGRVAREAGAHRYSRPTENYNHCCHYGHRSQRTTYVSVDDEESAYAGRAPGQQLQVQALRPRSGMEAGSNYDSQRSRNNEEACNVLLLKFNPRNAKNNKVICVNRAANHREPTTGNTSEQELQSAETPVYEDNEHRALPADEHANCRYNPAAQYTQNPPQNEQEECFYYPEGADPYEYLECYCPPHQYMATANQLYLQEDDANEELPDRRRPQSQFYECGNTAPDAYRSRQCARPMEIFNPNRFERTPQTHPQYMPGSCSKDTTTMTVPNVESYDSRNSGPDSYMAQQCAAVAEQIMKDYRIRHFKCAHQKYPNDDRDYCDEPVARRPQRHYQTEDGEYVECPGRRRQQRRKEVERVASPARHRASTSSKVPKAREYKFPQQNFLASLKSDYSDQGRRTPNRHSEKYGQDRQQARYKYDDRECVKDCPRITGTKDCRADQFPSTCLSALNDYNSEEDGQDKYYQKPSPASSPYEDYEADDEQSPKQFTQLRSSRREEPAWSPPQAPRRRGPQPSHNYEECNDDRVVMQVEPRQAPRRTPDRGQYSEPLASPQQRRRSNEVNDLQTYPEERRPSSQRKQQQQGSSNSDVEYIECPKRGLRPRSDNAEHEDPRNMEATDEPSMGNRSPPNSPSDSQLLSKQNSDQMYISQEELRDEDGDECRCELEPAVPESTSPRRSMQNDRPDMQMGPDISQEENPISSRNEHVVAEIDATKRNSRDDSQTESTAPLIASSKKKISHDFLGIPSSKRNSRNYQEKEPSPIQTPERGLHQQEDPVENPTHSQEFEELISCNDETCPYANLNVPETISSMENSQADSQLKPTPTSKQNYSCPENPMDLLEIAECACEDEPTVSESNAAERSGQNDRQEEPTAPEIASSKRDSRQNEDSVPEIVSSKRNSRNDRREKPTAPSSKRASRNSRRNEPILDDADECRCGDEFIAPGSTSPKKSRRNDRPDGRMLQKNAPELRISRQEEKHPDASSASQRNLTHRQEEPIVQNHKSKPTSKKVSRNYEKPIDPIEIDECPCDDEREPPTRKRNSAANKHVNEENSESEYEDAVNCELNPDECSKKANGGNSAKDTKSSKEASRTESEREHSDLESGAKFPLLKNIQNEPGKSKSTEDIVEEKVKGRNKRKEKQQTEEPTNETEPKKRKPSTKDISMESSDDTQPKTQRGRSNTAEGELSAQKKPRTQQNARALTLPAGGKSPRSHSAADRSGAVPKSRLRANSNPEEAAKKAIPARSSNSPCGRPNCPISGKRSMKHADSDGGPSRPFDLRLASYYICQLQDEDEANQYLIIVPEAKLRKISPHRDCPRQEPAKKKPCTPRQCSGFETLSWASSKPTPQSYPRNTEGVSALGSYLVPPVATETTLSILKQHIPKTIVERKPPKELIQKSPKSSSSKKSDKPPPEILRRPKTKPMTSMAHTQTPSHRPIHETNSILAENRTVLLTNNPDPKSNQEVIVLHPPVMGFRPSNSSLGLDDVQMRYVKVQHSQPHVS